MKTSSAKQKGRKFQQEIAKTLQATFQLPECDVESCPMGSQGLDVKLSQRARERFPYGIEAKNQETTKIWEWWKQTETNAEKDGLTPLLVFRRNRQEPLVCMKFDDFMQLIGDKEW